MVPHTTPIAGLGTSHCPTTDTLAPLSQRSGPPSPQAVTLLAPAASTPAGTLGPGWIGPGSGNHHTTADKTKGLWGNSCPATSHPDLRACPLLLTPYSFLPSSSQHSKAVTREWTNVSRYSPSHTPSDVVPRKVAMECYQQARSREATELGRDIPSPMQPPLP